MARIATLEQFAPYANVKDLGKADQDLLQDILDGIEASTERILNRTFAPLPEPDVNGADTLPPVEKKFSSRGKSCVRVPDLREITVITLDGLPLVDTTDYQIDNYGEPATDIELNPYRRYISNAKGELAITGRWGFWPAPPDGRTLVCSLAARFYRLRDSAFTGQLVTDENVAFFFSTLPDDLKNMMDGFRVRKVGLV